MHNVKTAARVGNFVVQRRWQSFVPKCQQTARKFDRSRSAVEMSEVTLESCHRNSPRRVTEPPVVASCFDHVVALRALAVRVDVADLVGFEIRTSQRCLNGPGNAATVGAVCVT